MGDLNKIRRWGNAASLFGVVQFLVLSHAAMLFYPGGSPINRTGTGYRYFENPYSDLGRSQAWNGQDNSVSALMFNTAMMALGVLMIPFFVFLPMHAPDKPILLGIGAVAGVFSSLSLAGIGWTPYDLQFAAHHWWLAIWVLLLLLVGCIHFFALLLSKEASDWFAYSSLGLVIVICIYASQGIDQAMGFLTNGMDEEVSASLFRMQKLLVLYCVFWYAVSSARMVYIPRVEFRSVHDKLAEEARDYLPRFGRK